jgi:hypothetical protein
LDRQRRAAQEVASAARSAMNPSLAGGSSLAPLGADAGAERSRRRDLDERSAMFTLSIALFAFALILGAFGVLGVAGGNAIAASLVLLLCAGISMVAFWRRRPA